MSNWGMVEWGVVVVILLTLVASGGVTGDESVVGSPTVIGDGTADASIETLPTERLRIDDGRFGTGVVYLRIPDARVRVGNVTGTPRVVYRVEIPALGVDDTSTRLLAQSGQRTVTVEGVDRAFDPDTITETGYTATVSVRIQSFEVDTTVTSVNETVEVVR